MTDAIQYAVNALSVGSLYALFALGVSLVFGVMRLVNFSYAALIMFSAFTLVLTRDLPLALSLALAVLVPVLAALLSERLVFRPLRAASEVTLLIASFALNVMLNGVVLAIAGTEPRGVRLSVFEGAVNIGSVRLAWIDIATITITFVLLAALVLFLARHTLGVQMRAAAEDFEMSRLLGVRADAVVATAFAISGVLAAAAAIFLVGRTGSVTVEIGLGGILFGFVAAVLGGLGSLSGAVIAGYALGITSVVLQIVLPVDAAPYRDALLFGAVFLFIVLMPKGIVASASAERV